MRILALMILVVGLLAVGCSKEQPKFITEKKEEGLLKFVNLDHVGSFTYRMYSDGSEFYVLTTIEGTFVQKVKDPDQVQIIKDYIKRNCK